jgi:glucose dehydrogenase
MSHRLSPSVRVAVFILDSVCAGGVLARAETPFPQFRPIVDRTEREHEEIVTLLIVATFVVPVLSACSGTSTPAPADGTAPAPRHGLNATPEDKQWDQPNKNYASTRYSGLDSINTGNVKDLKAAWTFSTGVLRGHEVHRW